MFKDAIQLKLVEHKKMSGWRGIKALKEASSGAVFSFLPTPLRLVPYNVSFLILLLLLHIQDNISSRLVLTETSILKPVVVFERFVRRMTHRELRTVLALILISSH